MATGDLTLANGVMKIVGAAVTKQYEEVALLHNRIFKGSGTAISDRGVEIPTLLEGNYNHAFITDAGALPAGGAVRSKRAQVFFKNYVHPTRLTGAAIDAVNKKDVSYVGSWMQFNINETVKAANKMRNIYAWGTGNGRLATISTGAASTTQTVSNTDANRYLRAGMRIQTTDGTTFSGSAAIDNPKASSTTFTVASSITSVTSDIVVMSGSYNLGIQGIRSMIDDTTDGGIVFQGISRNTYPQYRASRVNAGSVGLDVVFLRRLLGAGIQVANGQLDRKKLELWSHQAQTSAYAALGWNLKRFEGSSKSMDLGFTTFTYEGIPWVEDNDAPKDEINAIDFSTIHKYVAKEDGWDEKTGSVLRQVPSATAGSAYDDVFEAYFTSRFNYGCVQPNANGWVDALAVPTGF